MFFSRGSCGLCGGKLSLSFSLSVVSLSLTVTTATITSGGFSLYRRRGVGRGRERRRGGSSLISGFLHLESVSVPGHVGLVCGLRSTLRPLRPILATTWTGPSRRGSRRFVCGFVWLSWRAVATLVRAGMEVSVPPSVSVPRLVLLSPRFLPLLPLLTHVGRLLLSLSLTLGFSLSLSLLSFPHAILLEISY